MTRRTNEIGIRIALGATRRDVTRMVLNNALRLVCAGLVLGAPIAFWSERFAANLIVNLRVGPVFPVAVAAAAMIVVALLAADVPAKARSPRASDGRAAPFVGSEPASSRGRHRILQSSTTPHVTLDAPLRPVELAIDEPVLELLG